MTDVIAIFHFGLFYALLLPWQPEKLKFNKKKITKNPWDIIILHMCTKYCDQMKYGSWDMVRDGQMDRWADRKSDK